MKIRDERSREASRKTPDARHAGRRQALSLTGLASGVLRLASALAPGLRRPASRRRGADELARLTRAFDAQAERLRRRERELEEHKARLEDVLRALPDGVCVSWTPDGQSLTLNRAAEELLDFPNSLRALTDLQQLLANPEPCQKEFDIEPRSGSSVPVQVTTTPTRDRAGQVTGSVAVIRDMSVVKANEAQLESRLKEERRLVEA